MSEINPFSHVDIRVRDIDAALPFYERLLSALGFTERSYDDEWKVFLAEAAYPGRAFFSMVEAPDHRPNDNRVAFWVPTRDDLDRIGELLRELGATIESGPRLCTEYTPTYYAVFFEDPSGNKLEVVYLEE